jgi:hypothetical protein
MKKYLKFKDFQICPKNNAHSNLNELVWKICLVCFLILPPIVRLLTCELQCTTKSVEYPKRVEEISKQKKPSFIKVMTNRKILRDFLILGFLVAHVLHY